MQKVYVVNGLPLSGKTEFGKIIGQELRERGINFQHLSSIDPVKSFLRPLQTWDVSMTTNWPTIQRIMRMKDRVTGGIDWDGVTKDEFWRKAMSDLKTLINEYDPALIDEIVLKRTISLDKPSVTFVDIREPLNIAKFLKHANTFNLNPHTLLVKSDRSVTYENASDLSVFDMKYEIVIENNRKQFIFDETSRMDLRRRAINFVNMEILERGKTERYY